MEHRCRRCARLINEEPARCLWCERPVCLECLGAHSDICVFRIYWEEGLV